MPSSHRRWSLGKVPIYLSIWGIILYPLCYQYQHECVTHLRLGSEQTLTLYEQWKAWCLPWLLFSWVDLPVPAKRLPVSGQFTCKAKQERARAFLSLSELTQQNGVYVFPITLEQQPPLDLLWDCSCLLTNKETDSRKDSGAILCTLSKILKPFDDVLHTKDFQAQVASWRTEDLSARVCKIKSHSGTTQRKERPFDNFWQVTTLLKRSVQTDMTFYCWLVLV